MVLRFFTQKTVTKLSESGLEIRDPEKTYFGSRTLIQCSKKHRIPDPDPQHFFLSNQMASRQGNSQFRTTARQHICGLLTLSRWRQSTPGRRRRRREEARCRAPVLCPAGSATAVQRWQQLTSPQCLSGLCNPLNREVTALSWIQHFRSMWIRIWFRIKGSDD